MERIILHSDDSFERKRTYDAYYFWAAIDAHAQNETYENSHFLQRYGKFCKSVMY